MKHSQTVRTVTTTKKDITIGRGDILEFLGIPDTPNVQVYITVPGGGDYSDFDLDIGFEEGVPIHVSYTMVDEEEY